MSNPAHDQAALDAATEIMALVRGPALLGGDAQLKARIQCLIIDLLGEHGRQDAARYRWLRSRVSGATYRSIGIVYSAGGEGVDLAIDAAMRAQGDGGAA